jgi:hypothetical protein
MSESFPLPTDEASPVDLEEYRLLLADLCDRSAVPTAEQPQVIHEQGMMMGGIALSFRLEPWSGFVKVYADAGAPGPQEVERVYRLLLEQHLLSPAPASVIAGLHADSGRVILYGFTPLARDEEARAGFFAFVVGMVYSANALRELMDASCV